MNNFTKKASIFLIVLISTGSNITSGMANELADNGMGKFVFGGAPAVLAGIGAGVAVAAAAPVVAVGAGLAALAGGGVAVDGMRDILKAHRIANPKIVLKYTDPEDGKDTSNTITGKRAEDYVYRTAPLIVFAPNFHTQDKMAAIKQNLKNELNALARVFAQNHGARLTNADYISLIDKVSNHPNADRIISGNMDIYKARIKQHQKALQDMRMLAVISQAPPQDDEFADIVSEYIARIAEASQLAMSLPAYQERDDINTLFIQERAVRNQLQNDLNQSQANLNQTQQTLAQEQAARTLVEQHLQQTNAQLAQVQINLNTEQANHRQENAIRLIREQHIQELVNAERHVETVLDSYRNRTIREQAELNELRQNKDDNESMLENYRTRVQNLAQQLHNTQTQLGQEQELRLNQIEALRTDMAQRSMQAAQEFEHVRRQLSPLRSKADQVSPQRRRAEAAEQQAQEKDAEIAALRRQLAEARRMAWNPLQDNAVVEVAHKNN